MTEQLQKGNDNIVATDSKRREKKEKKKKRKRDNDEENVTIEKDIDVPQVNNDDTLSKSTSKELLKQRRLERQKLLELVPKVDENGISYTKK